MGFQSFARIGRAIHDEGKFHYAYVTKTTTPAPGTAGAFVDMNQTSGIPKYNAFAGTQLGFTPLEGSGNGGVYCGPFLPNSSKHLLRWQALNINSTANTTPPDYVYLCDYLGFYPLIDCDDVDVQTLDNTQTLTRYQSGDGVRIVLIVQAPMLATAPITITYTNSDGVSGRSVTTNLIAGTSIGVCATGTGTTGGAGEPTPFFPLASGDKGVRSIQSIQLSAGAGGFICAALVKPIASINIYETAVPVEKQFGFEVQNLPEVMPGAYLNFLIQRSGNLAGSLRSELVFVNS